MELVIPETSIKSAYVACLPPLLVSPTMTTGNGVGRSLATVVSATPYVRAISDRLACRPAPVWRINRHKRTSVLPVVRRISRVTQRHRSWPLAFPLWLVGVSLCEMVATHPGPLRPLGQVGRSGGPRVAKGDSRRPAAARLRGTSTPFRYQGAGSIDHRHEGEPPLGPLPRAARPTGTRGPWAAWGRQGARACTNTISLISWMPSSASPRTTISALGVVAAQG